MKAVIFLDRDGTIIDDLHYPKEAHRVSLLPHAVEGLKLIKEKGYDLVVVSNQSGVSRGIIQDHEFYEVHMRFRELLEAKDIFIDFFTYCFHLPEDHCKCRKPETGLIERFIEKNPIEKSKSAMVGDKECDVLLGHRLGLKPYLVRTGNGLKTLAQFEKDQVTPYYNVCDHLLDLARQLPAF